MSSPVLAGFRHFSSGVSRLGAIAAALILVFVACHIITEVVLRALFNTSTYVLDEFVGYSVAAMTFLALGHAFERRELIRVSFLTDLTKNAQLRRVLQIICVTVTGGLMAFLSWFFWQSITRNFARGAASETIAEVPLWIPECLIFVGLIIFVLQLAAGLLHQLSPESLIEHQKNEDAEETNGYAH